MASAVSRVETDGSRDRPPTIGAVCRRLQDEFPDISISKIRYLEDQGLLTPRRTQGGYRLYGEEDVEGGGDDGAPPPRRPAAGRTRRGRDRDRAGGALRAGGSHQRPGAGARELRPHRGPRRRIGAPQP